MVTYLYKILVEVRILHDFYLSTENGSFFENPNATDLLNEQLARGQYDIRRDIRITPAIPTQHILDNYRMRMIRTPQGFFMGIEVKEVGPGKFRPVISIPGDLRWDFRLDLLNSSFAHYTSTTIRPGLPLHYFFSNTTGAQLPSLARPAGDFALSTFEMGEQVKIGGILKEALIRTTDALDEHWMAVTDHQIINRSDLRLLPYSFSFLPDRNTFPYSIELKTTDQTTLRTFSFTQPVKGPLSIDLHPEEDENIPPDNYLLVITSGSGTEVHEIYLDDELYGGSSLGGLQLKAGEQSDNGKLFEPDGTLFRDAGSIHRVFELRLGNRSTYWRYHARDGQKLQAHDSVKDLLTEQGNDLRTTAPARLRSQPVYFRNANNDKVFLPNPDSTRVLQEVEGRMYSNVYVTAGQGLFKP